MIGFAHRGAPARGVRQNTLAAFTHALESGARALESDVWLSADGIPVLVHDGVIRIGLKRRAIAAAAAAELPGWLPPLSALYTSAGTDFDLSLDVKDPAAAGPVVEVAAAHGADARLWLCGSAAQVRRWQPFRQESRLAVSTTLRSGRVMDEQRIEQAAEAGAAALNLRAPEWTAHRVARAHAAGLLAFAWDVQQRAALETARAHGCDAIFSDYLSLLLAA